MTGFAIYMITHFRRVDRQVEEILMEMIFENEKQ